MSLGKLVVSLAFTGALLLTASSGCGGAMKVGETHVGKEELYKTGNFNYDEFFEDVNGLQGSAKKAVDDEKAARAPLGHALGVGETSIDRLLEVLKDKANEYAQSKSRVHLAIEGLDDQGKPAAGKQLTVAPTAAKGRAVPKDATDFAAALEQTAKAEGQVWEKYGPMPDRGRHLVERADTLQGTVGTEFESANKDKREEISRELKAAKTVASEIAERCDKVAGNATKFFKQGNEVLVAAANAEIKPPAKGPKGKAAKSSAPASKPKDAPARPAAASKPAAPEGDTKPVPKPAAGEGAGDFNP